MRTIPILLLLTACSSTNGPVPRAEPNRALVGPPAPPAPEPTPPHDSPVEDELTTLVYELDRDPDPLHADFTPAVHRLGMRGATGAIAALSRLDPDDELTRLHAERALEAGIGRDVRVEIARANRIAVDPLRGLPAHLEARSRSEADAAVRAIGSIHDAADRGTAIARARAYLAGRQWSDVARGSLVTIAASRTLYERAGTRGFFVRLRISNDSSERVGIDLRDRRGVPYLNQWAASPEPYRTDIDEERMTFAPLTEPQRTALREAQRTSALEMIEPGASVDVYRVFDASTRSDVESQQQGSPYLLLVLDGRLLATDGTRIDDVRLGQTRELPALVPIRFETLPAGARVIE